MSELHKTDSPQVATFELQLLTGAVEVHTRAAKLHFLAGAAEVHFACSACTTKLRFSSCSCGSVLRVLDLYYKAAIFELEKKLRFSSWSCASVLRVSCGSVLRALDLCYKVAIFELELRKCASRTRLVLQSYDFRAGAAEVVY